MTSADGVRFGAGFGAVWLVAGCQAALGSAGALAGLIFGVIAAAGLILADRSAPTARNTAARPDPRPAFRRVALTEGAAIAAAVVLGVATGHREWIAALLCLVVGAHFLPLATIFGVRRYRLTAGAMIAGALATIIIGAFGNLSHAAWVAIPAFGAFVALWTTAASMALRR